MEQIPAENFKAVRDLFAALDYQLAPQAVLGGSVPGRVYADRAERPCSALVQVSHRFYLAGDPNNAAFNEAVCQLFTEEIYPRALAAGEVAFTLYCSEGWAEAVADQALAGLDPIPGGGACYELTRSDGMRPFSLPADMRLVEANRELVEDRSIANRDDLLEEMQSERESVEAFLANSFGVCLVKQGLLVTWCLSEYNLGERCEVGIATHPEYRRRGLATATGLAFLEQAEARGITRVGWQCRADNLGSRATAERIGYRLVREYESYMAFYDRPLHLAVRGDMLLRRGAYEEAHAWFARAEATGRAPDWSFFAAGCAAARAGDDGEAFRLLDLAVERGFNRRTFYEQNEHLAGLRGESRWQALLARLA